MSQPGTHGYLRFQTKVMLPVLAIMVLLVVLTMWAVNRRFSQLIETQAARTLEMLNQDIYQIRTSSLLARYGNVPNEPRVKSVAQLGDAKTTLHLLEEIIVELGSDVVLFTTEEGVRLASTTPEPDIPRSDLEASSSPSAQRALAGQPNVDQVRAGQRIFSLVSVPVIVSGHIVGALSFGDEIDQAHVEDVKQFARCEAVAVAGDRIVLSTLRHAEQHPQLMELVRRFSTAPPNLFQSGSPTIDRLVLDGEPFLALSSCSASLSRDRSFGYVLLSSYGKPLGELRDTQQMLLAVSLGGILLSSLAVWLLVRKITQPLRELRNATEALGRGDFSGRVSVAARDECGELAAAFNRMTENLEAARNQLEKAVETLKTMQAQLVQSEKLSAVGQFVNGVAHELNNPLTAVIGYASLLAQSDLGQEDQEYARGVVASAERCALIVQGLLRFTRYYKPERRPVDLNEVVEASLKFVEYSFRSGNIQLRRELSPELPRVMADPNQLQQVFLNIIKNAEQAIESTGCIGWVRIATEARDGKVLILFQDSGPGIPPQHLLKVFDPFFTTKEVGKGTGLGLSLSYGIIQEHDGTITARSRPGEGATFVIELPTANESTLSKSAAPIRSIEPAQPAEGRGKRVLVIDDEENILQIVRVALTTSGYQVDTAANGEEGLSYASQNRYNLIVCDWRMPGLNGQQVFERVCTLDPIAATRFIFMTGDVVTPETHELLHNSKALYLTKPFTLQVFQAAVRKAIALQLTPASRFGT